MRRIAYKYACECLVIGVAGGFPEQPLCRTSTSQLTSSHHLWLQFGSCLGQVRNRAPHSIPMDTKSATEPGD